MHRLVSQHSNYFIIQISAGLMMSNMLIISNMWGIELDTNVTQYRLGGLMKNFE